MKSAWVLAWRYLTYHKSRTTLMVLALALTFVLPLSAHLLIRAFSDRMLARARATPLVLGARGDRFNLVLQSLYFSAGNAGSINLGDIDKLEASGLADAIPLHLRYSAGRHPLVGTSVEYFELRGLHAARGTMPMHLGQAVIGANCAADLDIGPGDSLITDQRSLYDIAATYPLKLHIAGVLAPTGTVDDDAVFVDIKTAWVVDGIAHGHQDVTTKDADPNVIMARTPDDVKTNASIVEYNEITPDNIASFHVHGEHVDLPLTAAIVIPHDRKSATLLQARFEMSETRRLLNPADIVREMTDLVFRVQRFFDANFALVAVSAALFLALIVTLSRQLRRREMDTMRRIGCRRGMALRMQTAELAIVLAVSILLSGGVAIIALRLAPQFSRFI